MSRHTLDSLLIYPKLLLVFLLMKWDTVNLDILHGWVSCWVSILKCEDTNGSGVAENSGGDSFKNLAAAQAMRNPREDCEGAGLMAVTEDGKLHIPTESGMCCHLGLRPLEACSPYIVIFNHFGHNIWRKEWEVLAPGWNGNLWICFIIGCANNRQVLLFLLINYFISLNFKTELWILGRNPKFPPYLDKSIIILKILVLYFSTT